LIAVILYDKFPRVFKVVTTSEFNAWLAAQAPEVMVEVAAVILLLREYGHRLARPMPMCSKVEVRT